MRHTTLVVVGLAVFFLASVEGVAQQQPATDTSAAPNTADQRLKFDAELKQARKQMAAGKFREAQRALEKLARDHERQPYTRNHLHTLVRDLNECAFGVQYKEPPLASWWRGEATTYDPATGKLKVRYTGATADFEHVNGAKLFPAVFAGPHVVEFKGGEPLVIVCWAGSEGYQVEVHHIPGTKSAKGGIFHVKGGSATELAMDDRLPWKSEGDNVVRITVRDDLILVTVGGMGTLRATKPKGRYGTFGFVGRMPREISIDGTVERSYAQQKANEHRQNSRADFDKTWDPKQRIPAWILEQVNLANESIANAGEVMMSMTPVGDTEKSNVFIEAMFALIDDGDVDGAREMISSARFTGLQPLNQKWIRAVLLVAEGRTNEAIPLLDEVIKVIPDFIEAYVTKANLLFHKDAGTQAVQALDTAIAVDPDNPLPYDTLVIVHLRHGRWAEARRVVDAAHGAAVLSPQLEFLRRVVEKAERGPSWGKRVFEHKTRNYHVVSDIDKAACERAATLLEKSFEVYRKRIRDVRDRTNVFRVFLFSGEASYQSYSEDILGSTTPHTAGLYSPLLKQLLIWNVDRQADMLRTVRHEGFHQYLDCVAADPPTWFNEGMAEYWERVEPEAGLLKNLGAVDARHKALALKVVSRSSFKLKTFLLMKPQDFYGEMAGENYAVSWAIVHYLLEGGKERKEMFDRLLNVLCDGAPAAEAIAQVFPDSVGADVHKGLVQHLTAMK